MSGPTPATQAVTDLDARYGRTPRSAGRTRLIAIIAAAAVAIVFVAWVVWAGLGGTPAQFQSVDQGYTIVSDGEIQVQYTFSTEPGTSASCAVQALNDTFAIVGWKVVDLPASDQHTRVLNETLLTTELAVTGLVHSCWLT